VILDSQIKLALRLSHHIGLLSNKQTPITVWRKILKARRLPRPAKMN